MAQSLKQRRDTPTPNAGLITGISGTGLIYVWKDPDGPGEADGPMLISEFLSDLDIASATAVAAALDGKADDGHTHPISDVVGLQVALDAKADEATVTAALAAKADTGHGHVVGDVTGLQTALDGKQPLDPVLTGTTASFTTALLNKLNGLDDEHFKGLYLDLGSLQTAHPTANSGDYAIVDAGAASDAIWYVWDDSDSDWIASTASGSETPASVLSKLLQNPDTNVVTDAQLASIGTAMQRSNYDPASKNEQVLTVSDLLDEDDFSSNSDTKAPTQQSAKAYADAIAAAKANAVHTHAISAVTGLQAALDGKAAVSHAHVIGDVTGLQAALDAKADDGHSHVIGDVTGLQTALDEKADDAATTAALAGKQPLSSVLTNTTASFTTALLNKLNSLDDEHFKGLYVSLSALQAAHASASPGDYAIVDAGAASDPEWYAWDDSDSQWSLTSGSGAETPASVLSKLLQNADTDIVTDAEKAAIASRQTMAAYFAGQEQLNAYPTGFVVPLVNNGAAQDADKHKALTQAGLAAFVAANAPASGDDTEGFLDALPNKAANRALHVNAGNNGYEFRDAVSQAAVDAAVQDADDAAAVAVAANADAASGDFPTTHPFGTVAVLNKDRWTELTPKDFNPDAGNGNAVNDSNALIRLIEASHDDQLPARIYGQELLVDDLVSRVSSLGLGTAGDILLTKPLHLELWGNSRIKGTSDPGPVLRFDGGQSDHTSRSDLNVTIRGNGLIDNSLRPFQGQVLSGTAMLFKRFNKVSIEGINIWGADSYIAAQAANGGDGVSDTGIGIQNTGSVHLSDIDIWGQADAAVYLTGAGNTNESDDSVNAVLMNVKSHYCENGIVDRRQGDKLVLNACVAIGARTAFQTSEATSSGSVIPPPRHVIMMGCIARQTLTRAFEIRGAESFILAACESIDHNGEGGAWAAFNILGSKNGQIIGPRAIRDNYAKASSVGINFNDLVIDSVNNVCENNRIIGGVVDGMSVGVNQSGGAGVNHSDYCDTLNCDTDYAGNIEDHVTRKDGDRTLLTQEFQVQRPGVPEQVVSTYAAANGNHVQSKTDPTNAKRLFINASTDDAHTPSSGGTLELALGTLNNEWLVIDEDGNVTIPGIQGFVDVATAQGALPANALYYVNGQTSLRVNV